MQNHPIKQHIVPLPDEIEPGRLALLYQLSKPRVVHVASKVARLDMPVPKTRRKNGHGNCQDGPFCCADELPPRRWFPRVTHYRLSLNVDSSSGKRRGAILLSSAPLLDVHPAWTRPQ